MKRIALTTALALAIAAPAFANDQVTRLLGVDSGSFSASEVATLNGYLASGDSTDRAIARSLAREFARGSVSTSGMTGAQLAAAVGVDPAAFDTAEVATIKGIVEDRDTDNAVQIAYLAGNAGRGMVSTQSVGVSGGHAQIAARLGLDAATVSLSELAVIKGRIELEKDMD